MLQVDGRFVPITPGRPLTRQLSVRVSEDLYDFVNECGGGVFIRSTLENLHAQLKKKQEI